MGFVNRRFLSAVLAIARHPKVTLAIVAATLVACLGLAYSRLSISIDENKLFASHVPFFANYLAFIQKFPENEAIYVIIEPRDFSRPIPVQRWTAAADHVTDVLKSLGKYVRLAEDKVPLRELGDQGVLFEDPAKVPAEFAQTRQFVPLAQLFGETPGATQRLLLGNSPIERFVTAMAVTPADDQKAQFTALVTQGWTRAIADNSVPIQVGAAVPDLPALAATDPSRLGYFYVPNEENKSQYRLLVRVYPRNDFSRLTAVSETVDAIRDAAKKAAADFGEFKIGVTGRPALEADEMRTTDVDSHHAEIAALIIVFIGLVFFLRSIWLALAAEIALGVGIGWTFGWATIAKGELNLLSLVFMIALIGIGMDYLVQILTRYRFEARRYQRADAIWVRVFKHVGPPINTACLGAAGAFLVSIFTDFQGAADLGVIAGGGLILCLTAGYTVLPSLLTLFPPKLKHLSARRRYSARPRLEKATRFLAPVAWCVALLACSPYMFRAHFDSELIKLQVQNLESVKLVSTLQTWQAVVLSRDIDKLHQVRAAVAPLPTVAGTESILSAYDNLDWLRQHRDELPAIQWATPTPIAASDLTKIAKKARTLADRWSPPQTRPSATESSATQPSESMSSAAASLRDFASAIESLPAEGQPRAAERLSTWQDVFVAELKGVISPFLVQGLNINAVPKELRGHLVDSDGEYAMYIYPKENLWDTRRLATFITGVESAVQKVPDAPPVTGIASNVYHSTQSIRRSFYHAAAYALCLILFLVYLDFRQILPTLAAVSVLALGLPMLVALMGWIGVSWNFANFFGLPILIGAGHEYGVFMVHRYLEAKRNPERVWKEWDTSDRALLLCAYVTFSSFGFFWLLAKHQGLKSLGLVMAMGTLCIYLATICVVRPILKYLLGRKVPKRTS